MNLLIQPNKKHLLDGTPSNAVARIHGPIFEFAAEPYEPRSTAPPHDHTSLAAAACRFIRSLRNRKKTPYVGLNVIPGSQLESEQIVFAHCCWARSKAACHAAKARPGRPNRQAFLERLGYISKGPA